MEGLSIPNPHMDLWGCGIVQSEDKVFAPGKKENYDWNTRPNENHKLPWVSQWQSQSGDSLKTPNVWHSDLLAILGSAFGLVVAEEELPVEELDPDHGKDEQEEDVDDEDVEDILEWDHDAVKDSLEGGHPVDHLERTQHSKKLHRLQLRSSRRSPENSDRVRSRLSVDIVRLVYRVNVRNHWIKKEGNFLSIDQNFKILWFSQKFVDFWRKAVTWT